MKRQEFARLVWYVVGPFLTAFGFGLFFGAMLAGGFVALWGARALGCTP